MITFGHKDETVASGQFRQRLVDAGKQLDFLIGDRLSQGANSLLLHFCNRLWTEALEAGDERARETGEAVSVRENRLTLHCIQSFAHFGG